jgi:hypothetical protein
MKAIDKAPKEVQEAMDYILDVFGGGDGGGAFYNFCIMLQFLSEEQQKKMLLKIQTVAEDELFGVVIRFARLIKAAQP